ncbi:MAG: hypothetical protein ACREM2_06460 [Vulcanimicrobiaceae bacterium]
MRPKVLAAGGVDLGAYLRAFGIYLRNPQIALGPIVAAVARMLLFALLPGASGGGILGLANASIAGIIGQIFTSLGLAIALIVAETAWRRGRAPFDDAWETARRRFGDIALAALGFYFVVWVASLIGNYLSFGSVWPALILGFVATVFFIFTVPAASIGGIPGGAAPQVALERARSSLASATLVTIVYLFSTTYLPPLAVGLLSPLLLNVDASYLPTLVSLLAAFAAAIVQGYVAIVLAHAYDEASLRRRY